MAGVDPFQAFTRHMLAWSSWEAQPGIAKFLGFYADFNRSEVSFISPWEPNGNIDEFIHTHDLEIPEKLSLVRSMRRFTNVSLLISPY